MWLPILILALICAALGGYVYLVEYRGSALEPAPADLDRSRPRWNKPPDDKP